MKMEELIQKVSEVYREERGKVYDLNVELRSVLSALAEADRTDGKNITLAEYNNLVQRKETLTNMIALKTQYYEGISLVREMLMDLGFDTKLQ